MKKLALLLFSAGTVLTAQSQLKDPVHFSYSVTKISSTKYEVHLTAMMEEGWHIYAQQQPKDAIAVATLVSFNKNPLVALTGKPKEKGDKEKYEDKAAGITQYQYGNKLDLVQSVTLKAAVKTSLAGTITYQACTNEMCLPPKNITFTIVIPGQ